MPEVDPGPDPDPVLAAVLAALAGARTGDRVAAVAAGPLVARVLLAASQTAELVDREAAVVVVGVAYELASALTLLAAGGRVVGVAADAGGAARTAVAHGLELRHVEAVGRRVAWSAVQHLRAP